MFEIIQLLRVATQPLRAMDIARTLEVTKRTIYRDIASLQAMRVPIEGAAGIGYIMRPGFDLPPINFDIEEAEAITVGLSMIARTGDRGLQKAALRAASKISDATPLSETLYTSTWGPDAPQRVNLSEIREAIRHEVRIRIKYQDGENRVSERTIKPVAVIYHAEAIVLAAMCELRNDFRHFRPDRILSYTVLEDTFLGEGRTLRQAWSGQYAQAL
jgi:predicted DNA-binding transcriptional regulator YafY